MTTTTPTHNLAELLSAQRAKLTDANGAAFIDAGPSAIVSEHIPPVVTEHGEIVPAPVAATPAPPPEYEPQYPTIPPKVVGGLPYVRDYSRLSKTIHSTEMVPAAFQGRPDAILACFLRGYELGFGPMQSLDSFNVIQGKVGLTAEAMRALIMDNGHQIVLGDIVDAEGTVVAVTARCRRKDWPAEMWETYTYSLEDARTAGLLVKATWKSNPRAMLDARATSGAGRRYFADVLAGMSYTPEEIRDVSGPDQEAKPSAPTPPSPSSPAAADSPPPAGEPSGTTPPSPSEPSPAPADSSASPEEKSSEPASTLPAAEPASAPEAPPAKPKRTRAPKPAEGAVDSDVRLEMRKALTSIIAGHEGLQQPLIRACLAQRGYGDVTKLTPDQMQEAIDIAVGWPDTAGYDFPRVEQADEEIADAEIVDEGPASFALELGEEKF